MKSIEKGLKNRKGNLDTYGRKAYQGKYTAVQHKPDSDPEKRKVVAYGKSIDNRARRIGKFLASSDSERKRIKNVASKIGKKR